MSVFTYYFRILTSFLCASCLFHVSVFSEDPNAGETNISRSADYNRSLPFEEVRVIDLPRGYHEGLMMDGDNVWVNNGEGLDTWIIDKRDGRVVSSVTPAASFSEGITPAGGGKYWFTDWSSRRLYLVSVSNGRMVPEREINMAPSRPTGVVWTGKDLYVITWTRGWGTKYHLLKIDTDGRVISKMRLEDIPEPSQIAWDGKNLWVTSWYTDRVYKIDESQMVIMGSFRPGIRKTTGIAWDRGHLWVTGTHSGLVELAPGADEGGADEGGAGPADGAVGAGPADGIPADRAGQRG
ncbi:MAG: hypothetical protein ABH885_03805 [Candidatus Omnitrophota bacterium]